MKEIKEKLLEICKNYTFEEGNNVVIREAYIPYIPDAWNGILVLAESQNLSSSSDKSYVNALRKASAEEKMTRLRGDSHFGLGKGYVGIEPWDNGSLKLAIEAAFDDMDAENTAVSNSVLWSQANGDKNRNPKGELQKRSQKIWDEMLTALAPKLIICSGAIAARMLEGTKWSGTPIKLRHSSPQAISRVLDMFDVEDLLSRYPEVKRVVERKPEWVESYRRNNIFFACHAVSMNISNRHQE